MPTLKKILFPILLTFLTTVPAWAQSVNIDLGDSGGSSTARIVQLVLLLTVLSVAPSILVMITSFTRIAIVFSITRQALGTSQTPSNMILVALALFMTGFIMTPTFEKAWNTGIYPLIEEKIETKTAVERTVQPFKEFMLKNVRPKDLQLFMDFSKTPQVEKPEDTPLTALVPAFMISELRRAFEIGFLIFVPFLIIDMVVASVLMSMGMMMLPPSMLSMPFKLIFFVVIDGWYMLVGSLVKSFAI
ncbi:MAG: flagellar type III secretion system pore protein FliP [Alphaproteobacteria bacterium]|nr:flagellar type III secretion system pore protein FliP [Alphaproteobacteria bacterium]